MTTIINGPVMVIQFAGNKKEQAIKLQYTAFCDYHPINKITTVMVKIDKANKENRIKKIIKDLQAVYVDCGKIISHRYSPVGVEINSISPN